MISPKRVKLENKSEEKLAQILLKLLDGDDNEDRDLDEKFISRDL